MGEESMKKITNKEFTDKLYKLAEKGWVAQQDIEQITRKFPKELSFVSPNKEDIFNAFELLSDINQTPFIIRYVSSESL